LTVSPLIDHSISNKASMRRSNAGGEIDEPGATS
jgi:hypothetical protein